MIVKIIWFFHATLKVGTNYKSKYEDIIILFVLSLVP